MGNALTRHAARTSPALYRHEKTNYKRNPHTFWYAIYPPSATPYLPSATVLRTLMESVPTLRYLGVIRFFDRDYFLVYGMSGNIMMSRATPTARRERKELLERIAAHGMSERPVRPHAIAACEEFFERYHFTYLRWRGESIEAHSCYWGRIHSLEASHRHPLFNPLRRLRRELGSELPFDYGNPPWQAAQQ